VSTDPAWRRLRVDGAQVDVMMAGEGDPLLFLHGWGLTPRVYAAGVTRLIAAGIRVIAPSLPGFGRSDAPPLHKLTLGEYAARVAALLDAIEIEKPAFVVGHSFGGGVAIRLASDRPDLVRSLTLINTVGGGPGKGAGLANRSWLQWAVGAAGELSPRDLIRVAPQAARDFIPNALRRPVTLAVTVGVALSASLADQAAGLIASGLPVLFVWSDRDKLIAPGAFESMRGELTNYSVPGRHGWLLADPEFFADVIRNALVVHAMLERQRRGDAATRTSGALVLPEGATLADLFPPERRRRARNPAQAAQPHGEQRPVQGQ
jgi:pimeloyl-ACP methyl ester carboxylesterase